MEEYTVNEIAELLNTNPETVRRWIRNNKLHATQNSKHEGNVISKESLDNFLKKNSKYGAVATSTALLAFLGAPGLIAGSSTIAATVLLDKMKDAKKGDIEIPPEYVPLIKKELKACERDISTMQAEIKKLEKGVTDKQTLLKKYRYLLRKANNKEGI